MKPHAFVVMPFRKKKTPEGKTIDFDRVYDEYLRPALEAAGLEVFRADQEQRAGDIRTDMFLELLMADLVVADVTLENPNVWYELGVRHALSAKGAVLVCGGKVTTAFDIYTDRKLRYGMKNGGPDPDTLEKDRAALAGMITETLAASPARKVSPVYQLLPNLQENNWKTLRDGDIAEFWAKHDAWLRRMDLARKSGRIGDVMVLADEAPVAAFRNEGCMEAGKALLKAERFDLALERFNVGLAGEPRNLDGLRNKGICLQRLARANSGKYSQDEARQHYEAVLTMFPGDPETLGLLGRVDKDAWIDTWRHAGASAEEMRKEASCEDALLRKAIERYAHAFRLSPGHYYSGINALTLMHLHRFLTGDDRYNMEMDLMAGAVRFAAENERNTGQALWALSTLGDLEILVGTPDKVQSRYKEAIAVNGKDWFALNSSRAQLVLLQDLAFQRENVAAGIAVFDRALAQATKPETTWKPRQVFLFSGHMVDAPDRTCPRFPSTKEGVAAAGIAQALADMHAGPEDLALTQGANGGDLLFTEACQARGVKVHWLQPLNEPDFIQASVVRGGESWRQRYLDAKAKLAAPIRSAPSELGEPPKGADPYERCNLWLLNTAMALGPEKVRFICLWNGGDGDGLGGTAHMYNEVKDRTGQVTWIDTRKIFD